MDIIIQDRKVSRELIAGDVLFFEGRTANHNTYLVVYYKSEDNFGLVNLKGISSATKETRYNSTEAILRKHHNAIIIPATEYEMHLIKK